jgi:hypothetical protein
MLVGAVAALVIPSQAQAQIADSPDESNSGVTVNYTEANVGQYTLPDLLTMADGTAVTDAQTWREQRRPEIVRLFEQHQFGHSPGRPADMKIDEFDEGTPAFDGKAIRRQATISFSDDADAPKIDVLVYVPAVAEGPVPVLLNLSFMPNSLTVDDPGVKEGTTWNRERQRVPAGQTRRWPAFDVASLLDRGFGFATVYYGDIEPDFNGGKPHSVRSLYSDDYTWGAIGAWSWGLSRAMDYLETIDAVDAQRVAIKGISRLGKTICWAGAVDERFALVITSCSGEGGAALSRRDYGETIGHLTAPNRFPYWFCDDYANYASTPDQLPVDAHMLIALVAPRPVLIISGNGDKWADPYGEFLAGVAASPVYELLDGDGLGTDVFPAPGEPILHDVGYTLHNGGHGTIPADWPVIYEFLEQHLKD